MTLATGLNQVRAIIGTHPEAGSKGLFQTTELTQWINFTQRFVVKGLIASGSTAALGPLVKRQNHTIAASMSPAYFDKQDSAGRIVSISKDITFSERIPIVGVAQFLDSTSVMSSADNVSFVACEMGERVQVKPSPPSALTVVEIYVDNPTDMTDSTDVYTINDDLTDWVNILSAWMACEARGITERVASLKDLALTYSAMFRGQWGIDPPMPEALRVEVAK